MLRVSDDGAAIRRAKSYAGGSRFSQLHICDVDSSFSDAIHQTVLVGADGSLAAAERVVVERAEHAAGGIRLKLGLLTPCESGPLSMRGQPLVLPDGLGDDAAGLRFRLDAYRSDGDFDPMRAPAVLDVVLVRSGRVLTEVVLPGPDGRDVQLTEEEHDVIRAALARVRAALPQETSTS